MAGQQAACLLGTGLGVVRALRLAPIAPRHVVEQHGGAQDLRIGPLGRRQALGQGQDAQDVVKVVDGIAALVVLARFFNADQGSPPGAARGMAGGGYYITSLPLFHNSFGTGKSTRIVL